MNLATLRADMEIGIRQLEAGQGRELDIEDVISRARAEHSSGYHYSCVLCFRWDCWAAAWWARRQRDQAITAAGSIWRRAKRVTTRRISCTDQRISAGGLSQTFLDQNASCVRGQDDLTSGYGPGFETA